MMKTDEIRESFIRFFRDRGHTPAASDSLVPHNDASLLFTGAGMNQFKEYFLGLRKDLHRAVSCQKCLRTGDLDEVGRTAYHHSFFEMLGNFSFGDYFKREAIGWAWEYLTRVVHIPKERLRISVHTDDEEAYTIWRGDVGIRPDWIYKMGDRSNFWPANAPEDGPNGPCGPCSEIYFDMSVNPMEASAGLESPRFAEIWNLVFTQFDRRDGGSLAPLAHKNIDTGMGLERLACVLQGKKSNFEIDVFQPIHEAVKKNLSFHETQPPSARLYAISDHCRAAVFAMADGVVPSNEGRGYVIRKIIRRALWHAHQIVPGSRLKDAFLYRIVPSITSVMRGAYPEIREAEASIAATLRSEEERFLDTLDTGLRILESRLDILKKDGRNNLPGEIVFELYDTYGFPDELTRVIAESQGFTLDLKGFEENMQRQRVRAKESSRIATEIFTSGELEKQILSLPPTEFLGYDRTEAKARVLFAGLSGGKGLVILDRTPFYGESGGQAGDTGIFTGQGFKARVVSAQKRDQWVLHAIETESGHLKAGDELHAAIDVDRRLKTMRNHTATHLLHAALRKILGPQVRQMGSLVTPDKLRFDYSWAHALTHEQVRRIEDEVNAVILTNLPVATEIKNLEDAKSCGAMAFFGEKYAEKVRVITVGDYSKELCGGTHCHSAGEIGFFLLLADSSVASGTRRIEAVTGTGAFEYVRALRSEMDHVAGLLKTSTMGVKERVQKLQDSLKLMGKTRKAGLPQAVNAKSLLAKSKPAGDFRFVAYRFEAGAPIHDLRHLSDEVRSHALNTVYFLGAESEDKIHLILGLSPDLQKTGLDAREIFKGVGEMLQASGGGRKDLVQGGARNLGQLAKDWDKITERLIGMLTDRKV